MRFPDRSHAGSQLAEALQKAGIARTWFSDCPEAGCP